MKVSLSRPYLRRIDTLSSRSCFSLLIDRVTPQIGYATGSLANQHGATSVTFKSQPNRSALTSL